MLEETRREYLTEVMVDASCPLIGQSVQQAGLRGLPGLFLIEIERGAELVSPVAPEETLPEIFELVPWSHATDPGSSGSGSSSASWLPPRGRRALRIGDTSPAQPR